MADSQNERDEGASAANAETIAAVDLGSNSFHMVVARAIDHHLQFIDRLREPVQLAAGMDKKGYLSAESKQRALECLAKFGQRLAGMSSQDVRAVGTNTLRKARDSAEFLYEAQQALGHPIDVISGVEEARLIYLGVVNALPSGDARQLVVDIGGGSTELIVGQGVAPIYMESLYMGCVSMTQRYLAGEKFTAKQFQAAHLAGCLELRPVKRRFLGIGWQAAIGASGTIKAIERISRELGLAKEGISHKSLTKIRDQLVAAGSVAAAGFPTLRPERAAVLPGGIAVLLAIFDTLEIEHMSVSDQALREGLLYDLLGRHHHEDIRERTVQSIMSRYNVDRAQAARVETVLTSLFEKLSEASTKDLSPYRQLIVWAARLHEIGLDVAHSQYHKHGAYLLEHADMPGFSQREQRLLSVMVRNHRRKFCASVLEGLSAKEKTIVTKLILILRLAVLMCRGRAEIESPVRELNLADKTLQVRFEEGWLTGHPLSQADFEQELAYLKNAKLSVRFE